MIIAVLAILVWIIYKVSKKFRFFIYKIIGAFKGMFKTI